MRKRVKRLAAFVLVCAMLFSSTLMASAAELRDLFDANYYAAANPDLKAVYGNSPEALYQHFITAGIYEGREASPLFNVVEYKKAYPTLEAVLGSDYSQYYQHYLNNGIYEGKSSCGLFDAIDYANKNPDLKAIYGTNLKALYTHYLYTGIDEGRDGGLLFNKTTYAAINPDLARAFSNSGPAMFRHYIVTGMAEGREGVRPSAKYAYICEEKDAHLVKHWNVIKKYTCTKEGRQEGICDICGKHVTITTEPSGHERGKIYSVVEVKGKKYYQCECKICGAKEVFVEIK